MTELMPLAWAFVVSGWRDPVAKKPGRVPKAPDQQLDSFDRQKFDFIIDELSNGKALTQICKDPEMPSFSTFQKWILRDGSLFKEYARARQLQADYYADETIEIADTDPNIARARNRMDARRWHASKLAPRKYGDRISQELNATIVNNTKINVAEIPEKVREQLRKALVDQMKAADPKLIENLSYKIEQ